MSAQAIGPTILDQIDPAGEPFQPNADSAIVASATFAATEASNASSVANQYGLDGSGQTIAIIDSGIAWDHADLGNGFGAGHKVVGGWDFAENDADPYDDGPAGFHGTHVAGIAAGTHAEFGGVAPGADLVGLRVFNDAGVGEIEWVESALRWVSENLDSFENPITTVNMSLGTDWNSENTPNWGILEDELAQLESEGVFISVAAGNSFEDYFKKGLSYPASSEHVVPVSSHGPTNELSDFSQRDDGVLVAPGERVRSTVPDHLFGTRQTDSFLGASGTSMAAPYVAGASAIVREAYAFMGQADVDQATIYETFRQTSNRIHDAMTNTTYQQLDLDAAISSIIKDVHSNLADRATEIGTIDGSELIRGTIGRVDDVDQFRFQSDASGQVELTFETSHDLEPTLSITDSDGNHIALEFDGERVYFQVAAGKSYQLAVSTAGGTGHYEIATQLQKSANVTELGVVESSIDLTDFIDSERTYSLQASRTGPMSFQLSSASANTAIEVYDASMNRITSQQLANGEVGFQMDVKAGESLFVRVIGSGEVDLAIENLISVEGNTVTAFGTDGADHFEITEGNTLDLSINGTRYSFDPQAISSIVVRGEANQDTLHAELSERFGRTVLQQHRVDAFDGSNTFRAIGFKSLDVHGSGQLTVAGSGADDTIFGNYNEMSIVSGSDRATGYGFDTAIADGKGGSDSVTLTGSDGNDFFFAVDAKGVLRNGGDKLVAVNFEQLSVDAGAGDNIANLRGSAGADQFEIGARNATVSQDGRQVETANFQRVTAFANHAGDSLQLIDSAGDDHFGFRGNTATFRVSSSQIVGVNFDTIDVSASTGNDVAQLAGSTGNDILIGSREQTVFSTDGTAITLDQFDRINVVANFSGYDVASLIGTSGDDQFVVNENSASVRFGGGGMIRTVGIGNVQFDGGLGNDSSSLTGSNGSDRLIADDHETTFSTNRIEARYSNVESTNFDGNGGIDDVFIDDIRTLDVMSSLGDRAIAVLNNHRVHAEDFDFLEANAVEDAIADYDMERVDFESVLRGNWKPR